MLHNSQKDFIRRHIGPSKKDQEKMLKEFETIGFYISDHPLNQYKDVFKEYNITKYSDFINDKNNISSMVSATIIKVQEKKTQKGNSYAIIKFSDLSNVFELFIFSDFVSDKTPMTIPNILFSFKIFIGF